MLKNGKVAYVFPGQGSQAVGMGVDLSLRYPSAKAVFDEVDESLGFSLSRLCFDGPEDQLRQTINVQPAVLTVSMACLKAAREINGATPLPAPDIVAGHSLGEYTALVVAGVLSLSDAVRLVRERGRLMGEASQKTVGGMVAVIGLDEKTVREICVLAGTEVSNTNSPFQIVVSGDERNLSEFGSLAAASGAGRIIPLKVSGAFHSRLMEPASEGLKVAVEKFSFNAPSVPVVANVTAEILTDVPMIKKELVDQITNCVQWQRSIEVMINDGVTTFFEIGHGQVLAGLIRRIDPTVRVFNIGDMETEKQIKEWGIEQASSG